MKKRSAIFLGASLLWRSAFGNPSFVLSQRHPNLDQFCEQAFAARATWSIRLWKPAAPAYGAALIHGSKEAVAFDKAMSVWKKAASGSDEERENWDRMAETLGHNGGPQFEYHNYFKPILDELRRVLNEKTSGAISSSFENFQVLAGELVEHWFDKWWHAWAQPNSQGSYDGKILEHGVWHTIVPEKHIPMLQEWHGRIIEAMLFSYWATLKSPHVGDVHQLPFAAAEHAAHDAALSEHVQIDLEYGMPDPKYAFENHRSDSSDGPSTPHEVANLQGLIDQLAPVIEGPHMTFGIRPALTSRAIAIKEQLLGLLNSKATLSSHSSKKRISHLSRLLKQLLDAHRQVEMDSSVRATIYALISNWQSACGDVDHDGRAAILGAIVDRLERPMLSKLLTQMKMRVEALVQANSSPAKFSKRNGLRHCA